MKSSQWLLFTYIKAFFFCALFLLTAVYFHVILDKLCTIMIYNLVIKEKPGPTWPLSYGNWNYSYICNQSWCCVFNSRSMRGVQHYVIKFVSDLQQVFSESSVISTNKTDRRDITEILLKVSISTMKPNQTNIKETNSFSINVINRNLIKAYYLVIFLYYSWSENIFAEITCFSHLSLSLIIQIFENLGL